MASVIDTGPATFKLVLDVPRLEWAMGTPKTAAMLARKASQIAAIARRDAPKNRTGSWNMYSANITTTAWDDGSVPHSAVQADRHPMVVEYGWRHYITKKRYPGWHTLFNSLLKARE